MGRWDNIHNGKYVFNGKSYFLRSGWEIKYAYILQYRQEIGELLSWDYEPVTYKLEGVKRGAKQYIPDFLEVYPDANWFYTELKGSYSAKDKKRMKNFTEQYPDIIINMVRESEFKKILKKYEPLIPILKELGF